MTVSSEYLLPLRWDSEEGLPELTAYLRHLSRRLPVTVVDGSPTESFAAHAAAWPFLRHLQPTGTGLNGKARGVMTGLRASRAELVVIADDDVRYTDDALDEVLSRLAHVDLVRPQNIFIPAPWHARWDTGRTLWNRAWGGDYSGTLGLRRELLMRAGGYDTDVLFENLQLERTVVAVGGRVDVARGVYVPRRPPDPGRFWEQRVRQAYDDWAQPVRLVQELAILPLVVVAVRRRHPGVIVAGVLAIVAAAEVGRRRDGGSEVFSRTAALWAPVWITERAITVWIAVVQRLRGGAPYRDTRVRRAASSVRRLRKELA